MGGVGLRFAAGLLLACVALASPFGSIGEVAAQESLDVPVRTTDEGARRGDPIVEPEPEPAPPGTSAAPETGPEGAPVELDQLLRLPNSLDFKEERIGGGGAADWRRRFSESERQVADARAKLAEIEGDMAEAGTAGSGQWQIAPPGQQASSSDNGPLNFRLREELRRAREAVEEAERRQRALVVEADLAGVPADWRRTSIQ